MTAKQKQNSGFATQDEKDALLTSLTSTMQDVGRLPGLFFAPLIAYISAHFTKIPEERKSHLKNILDEIKAGSSEGVGKLKDRFKGMITKKGDEKKPTKPATKSAVAKKTTQKTAPKNKTTTKAVAKKTATKKTVATKAVPKKPVAKKITSKITTKAVAKKATPKATPPKTTVAKKITTKAPVAKKATPKTASSKTTKTSPKKKK